MGLNGLYKIGMSGPEIEAALQKSQQLPTADALDVALKLKQDKPVEVTHAQLRALRDAGELTPGQWYRITDYVTTVNNIILPYQRSAGHGFDVLVMATDAGSLCADARAVLREGDTYFAGSDLNAWKLRYTLDNIYWSTAAGKYIKGDNYTFYHVGEIEVEGKSWQLLRGYGWFIEDWGANAVVEAIEENQPIYYYVDGAVQDVCDRLDSVTELPGGTGTITWMCDEFGNECPYDFKNVLFTRWAIDDPMMSTGDREELNDLFYGVEDHYNGLEIREDEKAEVFTFNTLIGTLIGQDSSLTAEFNVRGNKIGDCAGRLPDNVFYGLGVVDNILGAGCIANTFGEETRQNILCSGCQGNVIGPRSNRNAMAIGVENSVLGEESEGNILCARCTDISMGMMSVCNVVGAGAMSVTSGKWCRYNWFGAGVLQIVFPKYVTMSTVDAGNMNITIEATTPLSEYNPVQGLIIEAGTNLQYIIKTVSVAESAQTTPTIVRNTRQTIIQI